MNFLRKSLSALIVLCMVLSMLPANIFAASIVASGTCGKNLIWTIDEDGVLTISGDGDMYNYSFDEQPEWGWGFNEVILEEGVTSVGNYAFYNCYFYNIALPQSLKTIGQYAFGRNSALENIYYVGNPGQWALIDIELGNTNLKRANLYYEASNGTNGYTNTIQFAGGDGTETDPYQVATQEHLDAVRYNLSAYYIQTADIDLGNAEWEPIGYMPLEDEGSGFSGTYDGNGYAISNLSIKTLNMDNVYVGLFGYNEGGTLKNITLEKINIDIEISSTTLICYTGTYHSPYFGGVVGCGDGIIDNCVVDGQISIDCNVYIESGGNLKALIPDIYVGGVAGTGTCSNCISYTNIHAFGEAEIEGMSNHESVTVVCGGIVGIANGINAEILKCVNFGNIYASSDGFAVAGGISGEDGSIHYCINAGNITTNSTSFEVITSDRQQSTAGGIVGTSSADLSSYCINFGDVSAIKTCEDSGCTAGGIVGYLGYYSDGFIENCYNLASNIHADITYPEDPQDPGLIDSTTFVGAIYGDFYWWDGSQRATNCYSIDSINLSDIHVDTVIGYNGEIASIFDMNNDLQKIFSEIGLTWESFEKEDIDTSTFSGILFFTRWDNDNQIAYFGDFDFLGCKVTEKTDTSFLDNVENLVGKYVWVESEPIGNGIVDSDILLCIKEVETRTGTVSQADATTITIDGVAYTTPHSIDIPGIFAGEQVRYFLSNSELLGLELLDDTTPGPTNPTDKPNKAPKNPHSSLQEEWIEQHMAYAGSDDFEKEIVNGFDGELLNILRIALEDGDIQSYHLQNRFLQILQLDFEMTNEEVYELILAELFYGQTESFAEACFAENLEQTVWENTQIVYDIISTADNISDVDLNELKKIDELYAELSSLKFGTSSFTNTFTEFCGIIQKNFKLSDIMGDVLSEGKFILMESAITLAFEKYEAFEDIMWYTAYYEASQNMAEQTEEVLVRLVYNVYIMGDSFYVPDTVLSQLGLEQSIANWASLQAAVVSFAESLDEFRNNPNAIADYAVQRHKEANDLVLDKTIESVASFALDSALMCVPVVNKIVTLKKTAEATITANIILTRLFTNIDDKANNLELMVAHYVLSTVLYDVVLDCEDSMQSTDFYSTTVFDKAVSIYRRNTALAITYAKDYATLVLAEKIHELNERDEKSFWPQQLDLTRKKLVQTVESFNQSIVALNLQLLDIENTLCHNKNMFYDYSNDAIVYKPNNSSIFVVACPVDVIILNEAGEEVARLNGISNKIAKGYEMMLETSRIAGRDNDYIKVAIVPDGYSVHIEGIGEGSMNAFVSHVDGDNLGEVNAYFDVPIHDGSTGHFRLSSDNTTTIVLDDKTYHDMTDDNAPTIIWVVAIVCAVVLAAGVVLLAIFCKRSKKAKSVDDGEHCEIK